MATANVSTSVWDGVFTSAATGAGFGMLGGPVGSFAGAVTGGGGHLLTNVLHKYACEQVNPKYQPAAKFVTGTVVSTAFMAGSGQYFRPAVGVIGNLASAGASKAGSAIMTKVGDYGCNYLKMDKNSWGRTGVNLVCSMAGGYAGAKVAGWAMGEPTAPKGKQSTREAPEGSGEQETSSTSESSATEQQQMTQNSSSNENLEPTTTEPVIEPTPTTSEVPTSPTTESPQPSVSPTSTPEPEFYDCVDNIYTINGDSFVPEQPEGIATAVRQAQCVPLVEAGHSQFTEPLNSDSEFARGYRIVNCSASTCPEHQGIILDNTLPRIPFAIDDLSVPLCDRPVTGCMPKLESVTSASSQSQTASASASVSVPLESPAADTSSQAPQPPVTPTPEPEFYDCLDNMVCKFAPGDETAYQVVPKQQEGVATLIESKPCFPFVECARIPPDRQQRIGQTDFCFYEQTRYVDCSQNTFPGKQGILEDSNSTLLPDGSDCQSPNLECVAPPDPTSSFKSASDTPTPKSQTNNVPLESPDLTTVDPTNTDPGSASQTDDAQDSATDSVPPESPVPPAQATSSDKSNVDSTTAQSKTASQTPPIQSESPIPPVNSESPKPDPTTGQPTASSQLPSMETESQIPLDSTDAQKPSSGKFAVDSTTGQPSVKPTFQLDFPEGLQAQHYIIIGASAVAVLIVGVVTVVTIGTICIIKKRNKDGSVDITAGRQKPGTNEIIELTPTEMEDSDVQATLQRYRTMEELPEPQTQSKPTALGHRRTPSQAAPTQSASLAKPQNRAGERRTDYPVAASTQPKPATLSVPETKPSAAAGVLPQPSQLPSTGQSHQPVKALVTAPKTEYPIGASARPKPASAAGIQRGSNSSLLKEYDLVDPSETEV
ncbi:hypothetical protein D5018_16380 [Parashewanella curva]|uniref:Uncharacterized protein n=1 Tax=Parashewanella curva TaxID=2338552 RepID=A0A3L8PT40_9GAMM|nr:hypothetical protein [Parashewanella curva]RLV58597.1 hypothetical protein D5018_16380 [Parashewanella curva]